MAHALVLTLREARRWTGLSAYGAAWVGLALALVLALFPLRFTAATTVEFAVGVQPPALLVRGMEQLISSREMAYDTLQKLDPEDVARLAAGGGATVPGSERDARSTASRAAWRLMDGLEVRPLNGGRTLEISVAAPTSALAARVANAYAAALIDLQTATQASLPGAISGRELQREDAADGMALPALSRGPAAQLPTLPDPPRPLWVGLILMGALALVLSRHHWPRRAQPEGQVDDAVLPVELTGHPKVEWLDGGAEDGISADEAVERLVPLLGTPGRLGQVVLLTSDDLPGASAQCAVDLARTLAEDARVALVALDGCAHELSAIVSDPRAPGVSELLFGVAGFGETIHRDPRSRAHVIPPGRDARGGPGMVGAERLVLVLGALRQTYDFVVVAAPTLAGSRRAARLVDLNPLLVCIHADTTPATAAVEGFDALAARRFPRVVMLCLSTAVPAEADTQPEAGDDREPIPTMEPLPFAGHPAAAAPAPVAAQAPLHPAIDRGAEAAPGEQLGLGLEGEVVEEPRKKPRRARRRPPMAGAA